MLAHDVDRVVNAIGIRSWVDFITPVPNQPTDTQDERRPSSQTQHTRSRFNIALDPQLLTSLSRFVQRTVLDPQGLHTALNPVPIVPPVDPLSQQGKNTPQGKGAAQGKKGGSILQSQQRKSGRYIPPSSDSSSSAPTSLSERMTGDNVGEENDSDRAGRLRVAALGVVRWILGMLELPPFGSR